MSITGLDAATLARSLRRMAGDGSVEWVMELIQSSVLRDIADMLDENKKLRKLAQRMWRLERFGCYGCRQECDADSCYASECKESIEIEQEMRDFGIEVD